MKNKIFKLLSTLICISMVLTFVSPAVFAVDYDNGIFVQLNAPEDGKTVDFSPYVEVNRYKVSDYNDEGFVEGVRVCDLNAGRYLTKDSIATHEHDYKYDVIVEAEEGYGFPEYQGKPSVNAYIIFSGVTGDIPYRAEVQWFSDSKDKIILTYVYNVRIVEEIKFVSMNIAAPKQGQYPSYDSEILSDYITANYGHDDGETCINGISWHYANDLDRLWLSEPLSKDEVFKGGTTYRLVIRIAAEHDLAHDIERKFGFSYAPYAVNNQVLVNDVYTRGSVTKPTPDDKYYVDSYYIIYRDFYCPNKKTVKEVALEVEPPMLEQTPDFNVAFGSEGYKLVQNPPEDGFINGVKWRDLTAGKNLTENDVFEADHRYLFSAYIEPANENTVLNVDSCGATTVTGTMNGDKASIYSGILIYGSNPDIVNGNDSMAISYDYNFGTVAKEVTRVAVLDIEEPQAGEKPDYTATVKNSKLYSLNTSKDKENVIINGVSWENYSTGEELDKNDTFEAGNQYSVYVYITINSDYSMGNSIASSINGLPSQAYATEGNNNLVLIYNFDEVEPLKTAYNVVSGVTVPVEGELPCYDVTLLNNECVVEEIRWHDNSVGMDGAYITAGDAFVGGHQYQIELDIVPAEGYEFLTNEDGTLAYEFMFDMEGTEYAGVMEGTKNKITAIYAFDPILISYVDISVDEPEYGMPPGFIAYLNNDACYINSLTWYDKTANAYINAEDDYVFEENHVYVITADIFTLGNRCFDAYSDRFTVTLNNKKANVEQLVYYEDENSVALKVYNMYKAFRLTYEFEPCKIENTLIAEFDRYTGSLMVSHDIAAAFENNSIAVYIAFYNSNQEIISTVVKNVEWANDSYGETVPDDAVYCNVMLWNKKTLKPLCNAVGCETIKDTTV